MLRVTPAATRWITQLLDDVTERRSSTDILRLACHGEDQLRFTLTEIRRGDVLYRSSNRVVMAVDPALAEQISEVTIERDESERGAGVVATRSQRSPV